MRTLAAPAGLSQGEKAMQVVTNPADMAAWAGGALVPTMGALHEGHLALVRRAASLDGPLVVSIFVNPTQFETHDDSDRYPRTLDADVQAADKAGADVVFAPDVQTMYPPDHEIPIPPLPTVATTPGLEDAHRPGHFAGVCQVVARLFDLVRPSAAIFGEKDYQQLLVITDMVRAEGGRWPGLRIESHETVREADGLALSSRNAYLQASQRDQALGLSRALASSQQEARRGALPAAMESLMHEILAEHRLAVDYAAVRDARTLDAPDPSRPARAVVAVRLGDVRLIDNTPLEWGRSP